MMSPSLSTRFLDGMPCTISWLIEVQSVPGKPYRPLNAGVAPGWLRMNDSASTSRSMVDIPAFTSRRSNATVAARIFPPSAIKSISRTLLSWITCRCLASSGGERAERARRDVLYGSYGIDDGDASAVVLVPLEHGRRLTLVDGQPVADRVRLVVGPANQAPAILVARAAGLAARIRRLAALADRAAREPAHDLLVGDVEAEHGLHLLTQLLADRGEPLGLRHRPNDAIEQNAVRMTRLAQRHLHDAEDHGVGHQVAAVHVGLRLEPQRRPVVDRRSQLVARGQRGNSKRRCEQRRLCPLPSAGLAEEKDDHRLERVWYVGVRSLRAPTGGRGSSIALSS